MSIERFVVPKKEREVHEFQVVHGDAFLTIEPEEGEVEHFVPLEEGNYRDSRFTFESSELFMPQGAVAALETQGREVLVKHMRKKPEHSHGLILVLVGGLIHGPDSLGHYMMYNADKQFLSSRRFHADFAGLHLRGHFVY